jgi:hypothetical protein
VAPTRPPQPPPSATATAAPVPAGAARTVVLAAANDRFERADYAGAVQFYERVVDSPPAPDESAALARAIEGVARFRSAVAFTALGDDEHAREQVEALTLGDPDDPFALLVAQFWLQYEHTGDPRAACGNVAAEVAPRAGPALALLNQAGAPVPPDSLCRLAG